MHFDGGRWLLISRLPPLLFFLPKSLFHYPHFCHFVSFAALASTFQSLPVSTLHLSSSVLCACSTRAPPQCYPRCVPGAVRSTPSMLAAQKTQSAGGWSWTCQVVFHPTESLAGASAPLSVYIPFRGDAGEGGTRGSGPHRVKESLAIWMAWTVLCSPPCRTTNRLHTGAYLRPPAASPDPPPNTRTGRTYSKFT